MDLIGTDNIDGTGNADSNTIVGNIGNNEISGGVGNDFLYGYHGDDVLHGGLGRDYLYGDLGEDTMYGNGGADVFYIDNSQDVVIELAGEGNDTARPTISYTLTANVEQLELQGDDDIDGTGNAENNTLRGNSNVNTLNGADGDDILFGGGGNDILNGGNGSDRLFSDSGNDTMNGGAGDDTYDIDSASDIVIEQINEGYDIVRSSATYTLTSNVERLELKSTGNINGTGTNSQDVLIGNSGINTLSGLDGNDSLYGGAGNDILNGGLGDDTLNGQNGTDTMTGGQGNDLYFVNSAADVVVELSGEGTDTIRSSVSYVMASNVERLELEGSSNLNGAGNAQDNIIVGNGGTNILTGHDGNDTLYGNGGNDTINAGDGNDYLVGGAGNDTMAGGDGNDSYDVDSVSDVITESSNQGYDRISAWATYTMAANTERMDLMGSGHIDGTGNADRNTMVGNSGNNTLNGLDGNDELYGYNGNDILNGGNGADLLVGGSGDDTLNGGANSDTYTYQGSGVFGDDIINDAGGIVGSDTLNLLGFNQAAVTSWTAIDSADGDSFYDQLLMNFTNGSSITFYDFFDNTALEGAGAGAMESIAFADNTLDFSDVQAFV